MVSSDQRGGGKPGGEQAGFSLVEVNLAIMIIALGMLALFGLFPSALREAENAITDTHAAMFADFVLSGAQGNSLSITNWDDWRDVTFRDEVLKGLMDDDNRRILPGYSEVMGPISFAGQENMIRYMLQIDTGDSPVHMLQLWVWSGGYVNPDISLFKTNAEFYCSEVCFRGTMP